MTKLQDGFIGICTQLILDIKDPFTFQALFHSNLKKIVFNSRKKEEIVAAEGLKIFNDECAQVSK